MKPSQAEERTMLRSCQGEKGKRGSNNKVGPNPNSTRNGGVSPTVSSGGIAARLAG